MQNDKVKCTLLRVRLKSLSVVFVLILLMSITSRGTAEVYTFGLSALPSVTGDNVKQISHSLLLGRGWINDFDWSEDGEILAVATSIGIWLYDTSHQESPPLLLGSDFGAAESVALSSDATLIVSGGTDGNIRLWDAETAEEVTVFTGHSLGGVTYVDLSPDNALIASAGFDRTIRVWNVVTGQEQLVLSAELGNNIESIHGLAFSQDGQHLVFGAVEIFETANTHIILWNLITGKKELDLHVPGWVVHAIALRPDGTILAASLEQYGTLERVVKLWDTTSGKEILSIQPQDLVNDLVFSPDGTRLATGSGNDSPVAVLNGVELWDSTTGENLGVLDIHSSKINHVLFSADGTTVAVASWDTIRFSDISTGKILYTVHHSPWLNSLAFSPEGTTIAAGGRSPGNASNMSRNNEIQLWDIKTAAEVAFLTGRDSRVNDIAFSSDGTVLASAGGNLASYEPGMIRLWNTTALAEIESVRSEIWNARSISFYPGGKQLLFVGYSSTGVALWDLAADKEPFAILQTDQATLNFVVNPDNTLVAFSKTSPQGVVYLENIETREEESLSYLNGALIISLEFSRDGDMLASGDVNGTVVIWDLSALLEKTVIRGQMAGVNELSFSPDGNLLAVYCRGEYGNLEQNAVLLYDVETGSELAVLEGHRMEVTDIEFSADGTLIATSSGDGTVRLWNISP